MGADDYISKPFSQRLLVARIRAVLRRAENRLKADTEDGATAAERIIRGRLEMDPARHRVSWVGLDVALNVTEFMILEALAPTSGFVQSLNHGQELPHNED